MATVERSLFQGYNSQMGPFYDELTAVDLALYLDGNGRSGSLP